MDQKWVFILAAAVVCVAGCKVETIPAKTLKKGEFVDVPFCTEANGRVQAKVEKCSVGGASFKANLRLGGHGEVDENVNVKNGQTKDFKEPLYAGECAVVTFTNTTGKPVTCDFQVIYEL